MNDTASTSSIVLNNTSDPVDPVIVEPPAQLGPNPTSELVVEGPFNIFTITSTFPVWTGDNENDPLGPIAPIQIFRNYNGQADQAVDIRVAFLYYGEGTVDLFRVSYGILGYYNLFTPPGVNATVREDEGDGLTVIIDVPNPLAFDMANHYEFRFFTNELSEYLSTVEVFMRRTLQLQYDLLSNYPAVNPNVDEMVPVNVPSIAIRAQSDLLRYNLGNVLFTIWDKREYANSFPHCGCEKKDKERLNCGKCCGLLPQETIPAKKVKITYFSEYPDFNSVLRGRGCYLFAKLANLHERFAFDVPFNMFVQDILFYGLLRFILGRLMYGYFDVNVMLASYTKKFFKDLCRSRYCNYAEQFIRYEGYEKYFRDERCVCVKCEKETGCGKKCC